MATMTDSENVKIETVRAVPWTWTGKAVALILLAQISHKTNPNSRRGDVASNFLMEDMVGQLVSWRVPSIDRIVFFF
jgi:hypothetical protein